MDQQQVAFIGEKWCQAHSGLTFEASAAFVIGGKVKIQMSGTGQVSLYVGFGLGMGAAVGVDLSGSGRILNNIHANPNNQGGGIATDVSIAGGLGQYGRAGGSISEQGGDGCLGVSLGGGAVGVTTVGYIWKLN